MKENYNSSEKTAVRAQLFYRGFRGDARGPAEPEPRADQDRGEGRAAVAGGLGNTRTG